MAESKWKNKFNWQKIKDDIDQERSKKKSYQDDRIWYPDWRACVEKAAFYTIRFLPDREGNPFVKYFTHSFQYPNSEGNGKKWYINNCISTFGWDPACPICEKNSEYYDSAFESDKELAKERKRKQNYCSNILMVNDPFNKENNGKVFIYKYGYKIYQKIEAMLFPSETDLSDPDFVQFMPFDLFEGANFKLKVVMQGDFPNYDTSLWSPVSAVANGDDEAIDKIMESTYALEEFIDPKKYPSIEDTIKQVGHLLGAPTVDTKADESTPQEDPPAGDEDENPFIGGDDEDQKSTDDTPSADSTPEPESAGDAGDGADQSDEAFFNSLK